MAESYELLRQEVLGKDAGAGTMRGRGLLMLKGMAAWMKCVGEAPIRSLTPATESGRAAGIERSLVDILANMAFASVLEARA